jgi:hypothetical protein
MKKKMNKNKFRHLAVLLVLSVFMVTQYQNCAPAPGMSAGQNPFSDGPVHVINPVTTDNAVQFGQESVKVGAQENSASTVGYCREDQVGATIRWELRNSDQSVITDGYAECLSGGVFNVEISPMLSLDCGTPYSLVALLGVSESNAVEISRNCN